MASVTLAESAKLAQDELVAGVIENVITVNRMFEVLPFDGIDGNALAYNRENVLGDVDTEGVDDVIGAKAAATFTQVTSSLTTIIGDAEVNGLIQATRSGDGNDQKAVQIASKAKSAGRKYQDMFINGDSGSVQVRGESELTENGSIFNDALLQNTVNMAADGSKAGMGGVALQNALVSDAIINQNEISGSENIAEDASMAFTGASLTGI